MTPDDDVEILALMRAARQRSRGYADFFGWAIGRDIEELGVISSLVESLNANGVAFYSNLKTRGRPNDPPDCEGLDPHGARVAIEVTELVNSDAIHAFKQGRVYDWADWSKEQFLSALAERIDVKDKRYPHLQEPPYDGGYVLVVHTDEPVLSRTAVEGYLAGHCFPRPAYLSRAFLVLSYDPAIQRCPYFELAFNV
jgi:hypothetical protein